jgi:hypothetical protein
MIVNN